MSRTFIDYPSGITTVGSGGYTSGSGSLTVVSGAAFGSPTVANPVYVTQGSAATPTNCCHYTCTNVTGNVLTITVLSGTDQNFVSGDNVYSSMYAEDFVALWAAITTGRSSLARWTLAAGATLATGTNVTLAPTILQTSGTFSRCDVATGGTAITTQAAIFDIRKSSNQGTTWTSLWSVHPANRPSIAAGAVGGSVLAANFDTTTYLAGDWLIIDVIQVGTGSQPGTDITVALI